jgi:hypothetical protein
MSEPVVSPEGFTAGPLLLPGLPGIPAPEFCPLGMVAWPPPEGAVVCAEAGSVPSASAVANVSNLNMASSLFIRHEARTAVTVKNAFGDRFVPDASASSGEICSVQNALCSQIASVFTAVT